MKKIIKISGITLACLTLTAALSVGMLEFAKKPVEPKTVEAEETEVIDDVDVPEVILKETINENLEELFPDDMTEKEMQDTIHHMSHGLVQAEQKWGKIEITEDRVERLLWVAEQQQDTYDRGELYIEMLGRWNENDFSNAVADHNKIWDIQDGTIGKANRLLTEAEIEEYTKQNFE
ncbi:DUF6241 domain-containing protein [Alkalicoccobacillus murimartini]|uniref:Uncharacterized protein n=1 Tax=Alkalicoccobacillus murimartini TaxID=171685 RepID=A0ABT9YFD0_9BACI|nr:DUF6241 domain-containing protein [Alkalicoccobacillus murimartini]MDQ0206553.1 hypothetical protein [Alkalicoccobacillus murimartini]